MLNSRIAFTSTAGISRSWQPATAKLRFAAMKTATRRLVQCRLCSPGQRRLPNRAFLFRESLEDLLRLENQAYRDRRAGPLVGNHRRRVLFWRQEKGQDYVSGPEENIPGIRHHCHVEAVASSLVGRHVKAHRQAHSRIQIEFRAPLQQLLDLLLAA